MYNRYVNIKQLQRSDIRVIKQEENKVFSLINYAYRPIRDENVV